LFCWRKKDSSCWAEVLVGNKKKKKDKRNAKLSGTSFFDKLKNKLVKKTLVK